MLTATTDLPPDVYINPNQTRMLADAFGLGAIAVPGRPGEPGIVFRGSPPLRGITDGNGFYWGLALGALGMYGILRFLG